MEINEYLIQFIQIAKEIEGLDLFADAAHLSRTEFRMIREILMEREHGRKIIASELARRLGVTRSAVSQIVTKLEQRDIVMRVAAPDDKKIAYEELTEHSLSVFNEQCEQANAIMECVGKKLGDAKMKKIVALYREFCLALSDAKKKICTGKASQKEQVKE